MLERAWTFANHSVYNTRYIMALRKRDEAFKDVVDAGRRLPGVGAAHHVVGLEVRQNTRAVLSLPWSLRYQLAFDAGVARKAGEGAGGDPDRTRSWTLRGRKSVPVGSALMREKAAPGKRFAT